MKFVTYNIQFGRGKDGEIDLPRIGAAVEEADLIALQEVVRFWPNLDDGDQPAKLATLLPEYYWVYAPSLDIDASIRNPNGVIEQRRQQFGNMLLSRVPILASRVHTLPMLPISSIPDVQRVALEGIIETSVGNLRIYCVHLAYRFAGERHAQIEALLEIHRQASGVPGSRLVPLPSPFPTLASPDMPRSAVILGDFNMEIHEEAYQMLAGEYDPEFGRVIHADGFVDCWVSAGHEAGSGVTMPDNPDSNPEGDLHLDHAFITSDLVDRVKSAWVDNAAVGSDHQPVWFEIDL